LDLKPVAPHLKTELLVNKHIIHLQEALIHNIHPMHRPKAIHRMLMVIKAILFLVFQVTQVNILQQIVSFPLQFHFQDIMDNIHHPQVPRRLVNILEGLPRQDNILHQDNILRQDNIFRLQDNINLQDNILGSLQQEITLFQEYQLPQVLTLRRLPTNLDFILLPQLQTSLHGT
jgi:hypothetical protein